MMSLWSKSFLILLILPVNLVFAGPKCNEVGSLLSKDDMKVVAEVASSLSSININQHLMVNGQILKSIRNELGSSLSSEKLKEAENYLLRILELKNYSQNKLITTPQKQSLVSKKSNDKMILGEFRLIDAETYNAQDFYTNKVRSKRKQNIIVDSASIIKKKFKFLYSGKYIYDRKLEILLSGESWFTTIEVLNTKEVVIILDNRIILAKLDGKNIEYVTDVLLESNLDLKNVSTTYPSPIMSIDEFQTIIFKDNAAFLLDINHLRNGKHGRYFKFQNWDLGGLEINNNRSYSGGHMISENEGVLITHKGEVDFIRLKKDGSAEYLGQFKIEDKDFLKHKYYFHKVSPSSFKLFYRSSESKELVFHHFDILLNNKTHGKLSYDDLSLDMVGPFPNSIAAVVITETNNLVAAFKDAKHLLVWDINNLKEGVHKFKEDLFVKYHDDISPFKKNHTHWRLNQLYDLKNSTFGIHFSDPGAGRFYLEFKQDQINLGEL